MKIKIVCYLLFAVSISFAQQSREQKLQQLKSRTDIKVTEIEKDILKIEYPHGKVMYKSIGDYQYPESGIRHPVSPTFDSTIIDLRYIDTTLYYHKYRFWQEVPLTNFDFNHLIIGDVNNNGKPELYGARKYFWTEYEPVTVYELNDEAIFEEIFQYNPPLFTSRNIYDVNGDGNAEVQLVDNFYYERFFSKDSDSSLATSLNFSFNPFEFPTQLNDPTLGDFDGDGYTDLILARFSSPSVYIFEYNPVINNFDSVYRFDVSEPAPWGNSGFSIGDFDSDGKTDIVFGTGRGNVFIIENEGDNQYTNSWQGNVESYHAYIHTWTNDIDGNGKPEFWVLADAYYNGIGTTRITIFETDGDNSYQAVGRIDLVGVFSFYAGTMQAIDIDCDGVEEVAICIDQNFLILKFNGSKDHHTYEVYYIKKNELSGEEEYQVYFGATMYDINNDDKIEILISMIHIIEQGSQTLGRQITKIYIPDSTTLIIKDDDLIPNIISLSQNYPNPFNSSTQIIFQLQTGSNATLKVYNILGKEITTLLNDYLPSGKYTVNWEAKDERGYSLPSGIYFIKLSSGEFTKTIKAVLIK